MAMLIFDIAMTLASSIQPKSPFDIPILLVYCSVPLKLQITRGVITICIVDLHHPSA